MKHEWRKKEKGIYLPKTKPEQITVPEYQFLTLQGEGSPATEHFSQAISALYSLSYALKMTLKKEDNKPVGYTDYTVYPLEGIWDINNAAKETFDGTINKDDFVYTLMIRQPGFISHSFFEAMLDFTQKKKPNPLLDHVELKSITDGDCIQMLHIGSYDDEAKSFEIMEEYAHANGLKRLSKVHREIYLSDFRKVPTEKLKTVLRFQIQ